MVLANLLGSNVFNILLGLGLSWFIKTAIIAPGSEVSVDSIGNGYVLLDCEF